MAKPKGTTAERVTVVGAGYVGLVTAASLADLGHQVISMDIDSERIGRLQDGDIPIFEPGLAELVEKNRPRLTFTDDPTVAYADSEFIYICVDTPPTHSGDADLSRVWNVVDNLPPQELGVGRVVNVLVTAPVPLIADDRPGAHGHGGLDDQNALPILRGQVIHHVPHP